MNTPVKVRPEDLQDAIANEIYFTAGKAIDAMGSLHVSTKKIDVSNKDALDRFTICLLVLKTGFVIIGTNACVNGLIWDESFGRNAARDDATKKLWEFLGFELKSKQYYESIGKFTEITGDKGTS